MSGKFRTGAKPKRLPVSRLSPQRSPDNDRPFRNFKMFIHSHKSPSWISHGELHIFSCKSWILREHSTTAKFEIGEGTALIGDPTGRLEGRTPLSFDACASNASSVTETITTVERNFREQFLPMLNNSDWLSSLSLLDFVNESASFVRLQELIHKDSVKLRESAGEGMNMKEFLYPLVQAYDFFHLAQNHGCSLQLGGNDQVGNIDTGIALIRRKLGKKVFGLTVPLLVAADGSKIGKTNSKTQKDVIWLSRRKLRPFSFYHRILNQPDALMTPSFFRQLTFLSDDHVKQILTDHVRNPSRRTAQKALATELTLLVHGAGALQAIELSSRIFFPSSSVHTTDKKSTCTLADDLSPSERNFLMAAVCHPTAPTTSPLPVINDGGASQDPLSRLQEVLSKALASQQDRGHALSLSGGITLNGIQLTQPSPDATSTSQFSWPESLVTEAWNACDPSTGISVLRIGKRGSWFLFPLDKVRSISCDDDPFTIDGHAAATRRHRLPTPVLSQTLRRPQRPSPPITKHHPFPATTRRRPASHHLPPSPPAPPPLSGVDSVPSCLHSDRTFAPHIGLVGHLRVHRTETGEPVPGASTCTCRIRLYCPHCPCTFTHLVDLLGHMRVHDS
ncbi:Tyrosine--tRNA ligase, mitochondrial [Sparganum proliferum]